MDQTNLGLKNVKIISCEHNNGQIQIVIGNQTAYAVCPTCLTPSHSVKNSRTHPINKKKKVSKKKNFYYYFSFFLLHRLESYRGYYAPIATQIRKPPSVYPYFLK